MSDTGPAQSGPSLTSIDYFQPAPPLPSKPRTNWARRFIVDYNPFFLLSALCMLAGSLSLTNSMSWSPIRLQRVLLLTATINLYELILVALGLFLVTRRRGRRDGAIVLILEAFFLVDVAFLNAELFAIDRYVGLIANLGVLALAAIKLTMIVRVLRIDWKSPPLLFIAGEVLALFVLPGALKFYATASGGVLPPMAMFVVWWLIALLGAAGFTAMRRGYSGILPWFTPLLAALAGASLLAHAGTSQWVYDLHYWGADVAPILALASFVLCHKSEGKPVGVLMAIAALAASASHDPQYTFDFIHNRVTPMHIASAVLYLSLAWTLLRPIFVWLIAGAAALVMTAIFGPSVTTIRGWIGRAIDTLLNLIEVTRPKSQTAWGVVSITFSFVFLAIGALISLRRSESEDAEPAKP